MALVSLQRLARFPGVAWQILSRTLAVGKCRVHGTGRILYRIGFYYTWTYNDIYDNMYRIDNYMTYILVGDLHHYVSMCKWPEPKLQLAEERFMLPEASVEHGTCCRKFVTCWRDINNMIWLILKHCWSHLWCHEQYSEGIESINPPSGTNESILFFMIQGPKYRKAQQLSVFPSTHYASPHGRRDFQALLDCVQQNWLSDGKPSHTFHTWKSHLVR